MKRVNKIILLILMMCLIVLQTTAFADECTPQDMSGRDMWGAATSILTGETIPINPADHNGRIPDYVIQDGMYYKTNTVDGKYGTEPKTYVAPGEPVETATSVYRMMYTVEGAIGIHGEVLEAGASVISQDEDGATGTYRDAGNVTLGDRSIQGNEGEYYIDVLVNPVYLNNETGNYNSPYCMAGEYTGKLYDTLQDVVDYYNENMQQALDTQTFLSDNTTESLMYVIRSYFQKAGLVTLDRYGIVTEFERITAAELQKYLDENGKTLEDISRFYEESFEETPHECTWKDGKLYIDGMEATAIASLTGFGAREDNIREVMDMYKIYSVSGRGEVDWQEIIDAIEEDPIGPVRPTPLPEGTWSARADARVSGRVYSDKYDVEVAIPTSENLKGEMTASDMSYYYKIQAKDTSQSYTIQRVTLNYDAVWDWVTHPVYDTNASGERVQVGTEERYEFVYYNQSVTLDVTGTFLTHYFHVDTAELNVLDSGKLTNTATGDVTQIGPSGVTGSITRDGGIKFDESRMNKSSFTVSNSSEGSSFASVYNSAQYTIANRIRYASKVKNDTLIIKGTTVLGGITKNYGDLMPSKPNVSPSIYSKPAQGTKNSPIGTKVIPSSTSNDAYPSSVSAKYIMYPGFDGKSEYTKSGGANTILVHAPVVNNAYISNAGEFINQKINKIAGMTYIQLDTAFTITIPSAGTHRGIKGYGSRGYNSGQGVYGSSWGTIQQVQLPFDAYINGTIVKKGTWYNLGPGGTCRVTVPVWAEEGFGTIQTRVVAENGTVNSPSQVGANLDPYNYIATKSISVEVIGKIYDLRVSSTNDPGWTGINGKNGNYVSSEEFPFGQKGQNKNVGYNFAPKLGYTINFDFKTKGIKTESVDVKIEPQGFYFVSKAGGNPEKVDLYYNTTKTKYVKIEPGDSKVALKTNISKMNVPVQEVANSQNIMKAIIGVAYTYTQDVNIGTFVKLSVPENLRMCFDNFAECVRIYGRTVAQIVQDAQNGFSYSTRQWNKVIDGKSTVLGAVGHWYAGYKLPASTVAVPTGTSVRAFVDNPSIVKKNGYILVKFKIITKDMTGGDYLEYIGPEMMNSTNDIKLPNGKIAKDVSIGTIGIYDLDMRSTIDYETEGTH